MHESWMIKRECKRQRSERESNRNKKQKWERKKGVKEMEIERKKD